MPGGRPTSYKPEYCQQLIEHMAKGNSFWSFAAEVNVCFDTLSEWTKVHLEFSEAKRLGMAKLLKFDENLGMMGSSGQLKRVSRVERITDEEGKTKENTFYEGATFGQSYHIFKMKNRYPKLYRDKVEIEASGSTDKTKLNQVLKDIMSDPQLAEAARIIAEKMSDE